eukprot:99129_1
MPQQLSVFLSYSQILVTISIKTHIIGNEKMTWYSANDWCRNQGLDLISIHSDTEYNLTKSRLEDENYWIGLTHTGAFNDETAYSWTDGSPFDYGSLFNSSPWNDIEPNLNNSPSCVRLQDNTKPTHLWDDTYCNSTRKGFHAVPICQNITFPANPTINTPSPSLMTTSLNPANNIQNTPVHTYITRSLSSSKTAYVETLQLNVDFTTQRKDTSVTEETIAMDTQVYAKRKPGLNDTSLTAHAYIITASVSVCCMFIIGLMLIKCARHKHNLMSVMQVSDQRYEKARVSPSPMDLVQHERLPTESLDIDMQSVQQQLGGELAESKLELQIEETAFNVYPQEEEVCDNANVTNGYVDEPHDGIRSTIYSYNEGNGKRFSRFSAPDIESGDSVDHEERIETIGYDNIEDDEFIVKADDEDEGVLTLEYNMAGEGGECSS